MKLITFGKICIMRRVHSSLLILLCLFITTNLQAIYIPVPLTGFTADVVADITGNANGSTNASFDASNYVFMSQSYNPTGTYLPGSGLFTSAVSTTPGMTFQFAPYTANNSLRLTTNQTGALTFATPTQVQELYILGGTGQGFSNANITITFTDATTQTFTGINFQDWYNGSDYAIHGMGRVLRTTNAISNDTANPRLYQVKLNLLTSNYYKYIQSVSFTNTVTTSAVLNIMAMSILPPPTLYPYDPGIVFISSPAGNCFLASQNFTVRLKNLGLNNINLSTNPVTVYLTVTGPSGPVTHSKVVNSGTISAYGVDSLNVVFNGTNAFNLFPGGTYHMNTTLTISGLTNGNLQNDSMNPGPTIINYRPQSGPDYHLCSGNNIPFGQGLTVQGCASPLLDSATITFTVSSGCTDNVGASGTGGSQGAPANCENQYACMFASGTIPTLPAGAFFTTPGTLTVTNLALNPSISTFYANSNQVRFNLYGASPVPPDLYSPGAAGAVGTVPFNYSRSISASEMAAIYSGLAPNGTLRMGYWESWNDNATLADIVANNGGSTVATLKFYYYYYLPSFEWYDTPSGGSSLYALSPFNPLSIANAVVNNSNTPGNYAFYVACSGTSTCRTPVNLVIDSTPVALPASISECEMNAGSNNAVINLNTVTGTVSNNNPNVTVSYYNDAALFAPVAFPGADTTGSTTVHAKVQNNLTGCYASSNVNITINTRPDLLPEPMYGLTCNCIDIVSLISPFSAIPSGTDTLYYEDDACTIFHPNPHNICSADTVYIVVKTNSTPWCSDTAQAIVDLSSGSVMLANQSSFNTSICNPIPIVTFNLNDGNQQLFYNPIDCKKLVTVQDIPNGTALGSTSVEEVISCSTPFYNGQPYLNRYYHITPTTQDSAQVCLYYLQSDFEAFNYDADLAGWPSIDTSTLNNFCISKTDNGDLFDPNHTHSVISPSAITKTYDPALSIWTVCFPVSGFSYFYGHALNPMNAALPVNLRYFRGEKKETSAELTWMTDMEKNLDYFLVEKSRDAKFYQPLSGPIPSKAAGGNSQASISYSLNDHQPYSGHNYYRLASVDKDGNMNYSQTVDLYFGDQAKITCYPNPVKDVLHLLIDLTQSSTLYIQLMDVTGRVCFTQQVDAMAGSNHYEIKTDSFTTGMYEVKMTNARGLNYVSRIMIK